MSGVQTNQTRKSYTNVDMGRAYRDTRERVMALIRELPDGALETMVPACPAWSVRDVVAHLAANAEDIVAGGTRTRPPTDEETAAQIERMRDRGVPRLLADWEAAAASFEDGLTSALRLPVIDITSHEHDIRSAVSRPGARDSEAVRVCSQMLLMSLRPPVPMRVVVEDDEFRAGPEAEPGQERELVLTTSRFETLRWRMGRRSAAQLAAMRWSGDPAAVLDHIMIFGPADADVIE